MGLLVKGSFLLLFLLGLPVMIAIGIPSIVYLLTQGFPIDMLAQRMHYALDSYTLVAVPVFIFAGNLMNSTGITRRIFKFADTLVGRVPGGLAQVNIFASLIFSGMSGAALADVGGLGKIEIKAMRDKGFSKEFSGAVTCASATVGPIFPPSIPLVIYGSVASVSIVKLLLAGILPAVIAVILMMVTTVFIAFIKKLPRAERWPTLRAIGNDFMSGLPALLAPALLVVGMLTGVFTPTEAASGTVIYILLISVFIYRDFSFEHLIDSALATLKSSAAILVIIATASLFGWILAVEQIPQMFTQFIIPFGENRIVFLIIINLILLIVGMFLDSTTATLLVIPILAPPAVAMGIDPVHLGIIAIFNLMLGLVTPPMGLSLFMISEIAECPITRVFKSVFVYFIPLGITLIMITFFPQVSLWLPGLVK
ncbi:MAG: TRAP transporter large permease [Spirochaetales bacterium]|uniref:TRAP transporter large permease n=1 Tax=Candidatus Thalassospirochaeta sargassi TaxID=3119039 RepID=A0AAJ1IEQ3_9SPIO|nr:TRAP transporter large permease [Spirochaetales bacterium]